MTKTITKIGNSQGVMFDTALMDLAHLKIGDQISPAGIRHRRTSAHHDGTTSLHRSCGDYLCHIHPFPDGNKRTALANCVVLLSENGLLPEEQPDVDAWEAFLLGVASSELDRDQTAVRFKTLPY